MAPATDTMRPWAALIVAHGSPSNPEGPEAAMQALGQAVQALLPVGWAVRGATLAAPGALEAALDGLPKDARLLVQPHFMADGWFTTRELPRRLRMAGAGEPLILPAFGLDPAVHRLCLGLARAAAGSARPALLLAAHGSPSDPRPAAAARAAAAFLESTGAFREVRTGFVDQKPALADAARIDAPALCLPFFAGQAGHMETDVPQALAAARFPGPMLPPVGVAPQVPAILAAALTRAAARRAA